MVLNDFEKGGFPLTRHSPVICTLPDGTVKAAYNRYDLAQILKNKVMSCVGTWPGKKNTDCFILDPDFYMDAPPKEFKEIDNATEIRVYFYSGHIFMKIIYILDGRTYETTDKNLMDFLKKAGMKYRNFYTKDVK